MGAVYRRQTELLMNDDQSEAAKALARAAWIDEQMQAELHRSMWTTIRTGIAAGVGTTCSTILVGTLKWAIIGVFAWLGASIRF